MPFSLYLIIIIIIIIIIVNSHKNPSNRFNILEYVQIQDQNTRSYDNDLIIYYNYMYVQSRTHRI